MAQPSIPQLEAAKAILTEQQGALEGDMSLWLAAGDLVDRVDRLIDRIVLTTSVPLLLPERRRRIYPADDLLRQMMADGTDLWIAELLAWTREEVRVKRRELRVRPLSAGGSPVRRRCARAKWIEKWLQHLKEVGLWPA
jgi:hypothetical protein